MKKKIEKIEVQKHNGVFYYTGEVSEKEGWVHIETTRGEIVIFRREQIMSRQEMTGVDSNGKKTDQY